MFFSITDLMAIMPEIIIAGSAAALLLLNFLFSEKRRCAVALLAVLSIIGACVFSLYLIGSDSFGRAVFSGMFVLDGFSTFFKCLFYALTALSIMLSFNYAKEEDINQGEYYILMLFALSGMMVLSSAGDLLTIYIGLELMSLPVYVLTGFMQNDIKSNEAAMKYIILGAFSSALLLYGISFVYGITGSTELNAIRDFLFNPSLDPTLLGVALALIVAGFAFKVAAVPFHVWAPDAYEGAPTPITVFMTVGVKAAAFSAILRVFADGFFPAADKWFAMIALVSVASMVYGNIVAISQTNIKRMLAYSSIGHAGYALLGVIAAGKEGTSSVMFYLLAYAFMNLGAFGVIIMMRGTHSESGSGTQKGELIEDYTGLAKTNKLAAFLMLVFLFSLAGIPPTAGFMGKFYVFMALINKGFIGLAIVAVLMSAAAAFYYIRVVMLMYMKEPQGVFELAVSRPINYTLAVALVLTLIIGIYPGYFIDVVRIAALP